MLFQTKDTSSREAVVTRRVLAQKPIVMLDGTLIAVKHGVKSTGAITNPPQFASETVDLLEEMLFQRAATGIRPVLYLSSYTDLECSMLMLLDDSGEARWSAEHAPAAKQTISHIITN